MEREKMTINLDTILTCFCPNCKTIFLNLTDKQLDLINYIKENEKLQITSTEKHYYPIKNKVGWDYVFRKQRNIFSNKFMNEIFNGRDDTYNSKYYFPGLYNRYLFDECTIGTNLGILSCESENSTWRNINNHDIDPETSEVSHSYDVDIKDTVTFTDNFKKFENEYGNVYFMTYNEFNNSIKCPVCNFQNYKHYSRTIRDSDINTLSRCTENLREEAKKNGKSLSREEARTMALASDYGIVPIFKDLIKKSYVEIFENELNDTFEKYEKEIENNSIITPKCEKSLDFNLTDFLECLVNCEKNKRVLTEILKNQIKNYCKNKISLEKKKKTITTQYTKTIDENIRRINQNIDKLNNKVELSKEDLLNNNIKYPTEPIQPSNNDIIKPQKPILKKARFFNKTRVAIENQNLLKTYELDLKEYEEKERKYEADIQEYHKLYSKYEDEYKIFKKQYKDLEEKINNENKIKIKELKKEIENEKNNIYDNINMQVKELPESKICEYFLKEMDDIKNEIIKINISVNQLNALNIIYPKYNNFIAITTFYEYFLTGRCDSLTGSTGAYNLYENELRSNIIIDKLDIIIEKLDNIKENQYQMYCVLNEINEMQKNICSSLDKVVDEITSISKSAKNIETLSSVTAYNTTKMAYYSQINNKLLKTIGVLITLK